MTKFCEECGQRSSLLFEGLWDSPKALLIHFLHEFFDRPILVISSGDRENKLYDDLKYFSDHVLELMAWEALPGEDILPSPDIVGRRLDVLNEIGIAKVPKIIMAPLAALIQKVPNKNALISSFHTFRAKEHHPFEQIPSILTKLGYERVSIVNDKGQFAVRGGIIDVYPISSPSPYRLDFFGDEIETIKTFDPAGQISVEQVASFKIGPASEMPLLEMHQSTIFDYLSSHPIVLYDDLLAIEDQYTSLSQMPGFKSKYVMNFDEFFAFPTQLNLYLTRRPVEELSAAMKHTKAGRDYFSGKNPIEDISFEMFGKEINSSRMAHPFFPLAEYFDISTSSVEIQKENLASSLQRIATTSTEVYLIAEHESEKNKMLAWLPTRPKNTEFVKGYLSSGFAMTDINMVTITFSDLTARYKVRRKKWRTSYHTPASEFHQLEVGDYVVHFHNGVGKYLGTEQQKNHLGIESEFLIIEYAEGSKLYVPASQAHLVSKYIGSQQEKPDLHKIGTNKWSKAKQSATKAIIGYAKDLLQMQAERQTTGGFQYNEDSLEMIQFEEEFPYVETDDQLLAIDAIKQDMVSEKPIDRLICGDVGYGKTEVAMRAAFKAVVDGGKQVAVLVPTTVLAVQHYESFKNRMDNFGINVGVVSRFQKPKEIKQTLDKLSKGSVDIIIGTHRLLSSDIIFKDLGMIIIDEEQRFGVRAKEKLKRLKAEVDCLTLTATPIPRTLYMSLINIRDMSVINSPPQDRLPIKTIICERDFEVIKTALLREFARDGQAYFIHNRVESIFGVAEEIQKLIPQAKIGVAHGQMDSDRIDQVFHDFKTGQIDLLVATSLVENGIDIPNANTILIDRAHHFGVADLYQLRGRVGRWNKSAYAYFLTPKNRALPEISQKRLQALVEASGYGGGMRLAMRDLEIRGAGDILGVKQSGHVSTVGFHLYCKLLKKAVDALKNKKPASFVEAKLEFTFDAKIPSYYIDDSSIRLEIYHRLGDATTFEEVDQILLELKDRFGKPPEPLLWLYHMTRIRVYATQNNFLSLKYDGKNGLFVEKQGKKEVQKKSFLIPPGLNAKEIELVTIKRLSEGF